MNEIVITNTNGQLTVSSLQIAESFEKQHKDVLEKITALRAENSAVTLNSFRQKQTEQQQ